MFLMYFLYCIFYMLTCLQTKFPFGIINLLLLLLSPFILCYLINEVITVFFTFNIYYGRSSTAISLYTCCAMTIKILFYSILYVQVYIGAHVQPCSVGKPLNCAWDVSLIMSILNVQYVCTYSIEISNQCVHVRPVEGPIDQQQRPCLPQARPKQAIARNPKDLLFALHTPVYRFLLNVNPTTVYCMQKKTDHVNTW